MEKKRMVALLANQEELAKIEAIKQAKGIRSDAELIRIVLNEEGKKILIKNIHTVIN